MPDPVKVERKKWPWWEQYDETADALDARARAEADDVAALGFERHRLVRDGDGGRRLDAVQRV